MKKPKRPLLWFALPDMTMEQFNEHRQKYRRSSDPAISKAERLEIRVGLLKAFAVPESYVSNQMFMGFLLDYIFQNFPNIIALRSKKLAPGMSVRSGSKVGTIATCNPFNGRLTVNWSDGTKGRMLRADDLEVCDRTVA